MATCACNAGYHAATAPARGCVKNVGMPTIPPNFRVSGQLLNDAAGVFITITDKNGNIVIGSAVSDANGHYSARIKYTGSNVAFTWGMNSQCLTFMPAYNVVFNLTAPSAVCTTPSSPIAAP